MGIKTINLTETDLSQDQKIVYNNALSWLKNKSDKILSIGGVAGSGKGQPLNAVVLTPYGEIRMGDIVPGTQILNPDGTIAKVLFVHELGERDVYKVTFFDGVSTNVTLDHLWLVRIAGKKFKANRKLADGSVCLDRIETTEQLMQRTSHYKDKRRKFIPEIPLSSPVGFNFIFKYDLDPYVLGVLLGDGGLTGKSIKLTSFDTEIIENVESKLGMKISKTKIKGQFIIPKKTNIKLNLIELDLYGKHSYDKFIPKKYKFASVESRYELICGLMDTDGTVSKGSGVSYTTTSPILAEDVKFVLQSLGYRVTITSRIPTYNNKYNEKVKGRLAYTLHIQGKNKKKLFKLSRKVNRCIEYNNGRNEVTRRVESVQYVGKEVCRCITVDHPNGLYLTNDFIVTHNSTLIGLLSKKFGFNTAYCAYTGKAANVLRKKLSDKGASYSYCGTIHGLIYRPIIDKKTQCVSGWMRNPSIAEDLIVIDEASMVGSKIWFDLLKYNKKILLVGDHKQLPPVNSYMNLMEKPMLRLEKIHRQAEDNPIIKLSAHIREGKGINAFKTNGDDRIVFLDDDGDIIDRTLYSMFENRDTRLDSVVLSYFNTTRVEANQRVRKLIGYDGYPNKDDVVICLMNMTVNDLQIYNGMRGYVERCSLSEPDRFSAKIDFSDEGFKISGYLSKYQFNQTATFKSPLDLANFGMNVRNWAGVGLLFDFGYGLTCHKFQGSQASNVMVIMQRSNKCSEEDYNRWVYTAVTRSSDKLYIIR